MKARLCAATLLFACAAAAAEVWYEAYDAALKAIASQQWTTAEAKLKSAIKEGPKPGRRIRTYGMQFIDFMPGYHLGVVYYRQERHKEALEELRKARASGLFAENDAEFKTLSQMIQASEAATTVKTAKIEPAPAAAEPTPRPSEAAREPEARVSAASRPSEPPPAESTARPSLEAKVAVPKSQATRTLADVRPEPARRATDSRPLTPGASETERLALRAFFGGDYATAIRLLDEIALGGSQSAETLFYLGASYAAQSFLAERQREELLVQARRRFAEARRLNPSFRADPRLVSPRILRLYEQAGS